MEATTTRRIDRGSLGRESLQRRTELLVKTATNFHSDFNTSIWSRNPKAAVTVGGEVKTPSYHHDGHVGSTEEAINAVFTKKDEGMDPFRIDEELQRWNERNPQFQVQAEDVRTVFEVAYACHDLGNLTQSDKFTSDGRLPFADQYLKEGAEVRSAALFDALADRFLTSALNMTAERLAGIKALGKHLIMQTVFDFGKTTSDEPFWKPVQVIDQFASYYFSPLSKEAYIAGLLNEERVRGQDPPNFKKYLLFPKMRLEAVVPDQTERHEILKIFEMNPYGKSAEYMYTIPDSLGKIEDLDRDVVPEKDIPMLIAA